MPTVLTYLRGIHNTSNADFISNISMLTLGSIIAQLMTVATIPIITRLYGAEAFGLTGVLMAIVALFGTICTGRYNLAIMLPKSQVQSQQLMVLCLCVCGAMSFLILISCYWSSYLAKSLSMPAVDSVLIYVPFIVIALGINQTIDQNLSRNKKFKVIALAVLVGSLVGNVFKIILGVLSGSVEWLILGTALTFLVQAFIMNSLSRENIAEFKTIRNSKTRRNVMALARRYSYLPKYRAPKDFLNCASRNAPVVLIAVIFGAEEAGYFALSEKLLSIPVIFVGEAVRKVLYQKSSDVYKRGGLLSDLILKSTALLSLVALLPFGVVAAFGPGIVELIFGGHWSASGQYVQWMSVFTFFLFINIPCVVVIPILRAERKYFVFEIATLFVRCGCLFVGGLWLNESNVAVMLFSIGSSLLYIYLIWSVYIMCLSREKEYKSS